MTGKYQCGNCGGVFEKGWSDEEAQAEYETNFPECQGNETEPVCDDCYVAILKWLGHQAADRNT